MDPLQARDESRFLARRQLHGHHWQLTSSPAVRTKITCDAADRIGCAASEIDNSVVIEVDCIPAITGRHELRQTHRAGIRTLELERIDTHFLGEQQQLLQLVAEVLLPSR